MQISAHSTVFIRLPVQFEQFITKIRMNLRQKFTSSKTGSDQQGEQGSFTLSENEESYIPRYRRPRRRYNSPQAGRPKAQASKKYNESFWSDSENLTYMSFLQEFAQLFNSDWWERKSLKINVLMSNYIKTRSPLQCRSHHQKMMKFHSSIPQIIRYLSKLAKPIEQSVLQSRSDDYEKQRWNETEVILQELSEKIRWAQEEDDLWDRIMCEEVINDY